MLHLISVAFVRDPVKTNDSDSGRPVSKSFGRRRATNGSAVRCSMEQLLNDLPLKQGGEDNL